MMDLQEKELMYSDFINYIDNTRILYEESRILVKKYLLRFYDIEKLFKDYELANDLVPVLNSALELWYQEIKPEYRFNYMDTTKIIILFKKYIFDEIVELRNHLKSDYYKDENDKDLV